MKRVGPCPAVFILSNWSRKKAFGLERCFYSVRKGGSGISRIRIDCSRVNEATGARWILHIKEAKYLHDYVIWLRFNDGTEGEIDLSGELEGEIFGSLRDLNKFKSFKVDPVLETIRQQLLF